MLQNLEHILLSPYFHFVAVLLLALALARVLGKLAEANRIITGQAYVIDKQRSQISALEEQLKAEAERYESELQQRVKMATKAALLGLEGKANGSADGADEADEFSDSESVVLLDDNLMPIEKLSGSDEDLLNRFVMFLDENLSDINLSTDVIASDMCMSRSNLFRKIKQITGLGPNESIRLVRLKRAADMLREGRLSIADICMLVGFNSPSYFSSCFKKHYGCLPKDYK